MATAHRATEFTSEYVTPRSTVAYIFKRMLLFALGTYVKYCKHAFSTGLNEKIQIERQDLSSRSVSTLKDLDSALLKL